MTREMELPTLEDIKQARLRLSGIAQNTPLDYSKTFSDLSENQIYLKLENLQKTGSFKLRGAYNKISQLTEAEKQRGVIAASAGNHAQGVAFAASLHQSPCTIVMPETASLAKIAATQSYGAKVELHGDSYDDAYDYARSLQQERGYTYVHAFDDPLVISGQGTIGLEILEQCPTVSAIIVPMGGGGLAGGIALAAKSLRPDMKVIGVQAANVASFPHSLTLGHADKLEKVSGTIADGIAVKRPGDITFALASKWIDSILTVEEEEIARSMVLLMERSKIVAEGAAAAAVAAAIYQKIPDHMGDVVIVLSGGNVDVHTLSRIIEHGLVESKRYLRLAVTLTDRPGALRDLLDVFAILHANVLSVEHHRLGSRISFGQTEVEIDLETRDEAHINAIMRSLEQKGYQPVNRC